MVVLTDDDPKNTLRFAVIALLLGIALAAVASFVAYEFTYMGWGADFDDYKRGGVTALIALGFVLSFVMIYIGAATWSSERANRHEPPQYPTYP